MSTNYNFLYWRDVPDMKSFRKFLKDNGFTIDQEKTDGSFHMCIKKDEQYLWVYPVKVRNRIRVAGFCRFGSNKVEEIIELIQEHFGTIVSEHCEFPPNSFPPFNLNKVGVAHLAE